MLNHVIIMTIFIIYVHYHDVELSGFLVAQLNILSYQRNG